MQYFSSEEVREALYHYVQLTFSDYDCEELASRFEIQCCDSEMHTIGCEIKWFSLKHYLNSLMVEELGQNPWKPSILPLMSYTQ